MSGIIIEPLFPVTRYDPTSGAWVSDSLVVEKQIDLLDDFIIRDMSVAQPAYIFHSGELGFEVGNAGYGIIVLTGPFGLSNVQSIIYPLSVFGTKWQAQPFTELTIEGFQSNIIIENNTSGYIELYGTDAVYIYSDNFIYIAPSAVGLYVRTFAPAGVDEYHGVDDGAIRSFLIYDDLTIGSSTFPRTLTHYGEVDVVMDTPQITSWHDPLFVQQLDINMNAASQNIELTGIGNVSGSFFDLYEDPVDATFELRAATASHDLFMQVTTSVDPTITGTPNLRLTSPFGGDVKLVPGRNLYLAPTTSIFIPVGTPLYVDEALGVGVNYIMWNPGFQQLEFTNSFALTGGAGTWMTPPKMTTTQRNAMVGGFGSGDKGKMWFNTTTNQWEGWTGSAVTIIG